MDKEIKRLNNEKKILTERLGKFEKENEEMKIKIKELNVEIERLNKKIKELNIEIERLNKRIKELLIEIEKYKIQIFEMESKEKLKVKKPKDRNAQFCELFKSFSKKVILRYKLEMIIGMFVRQKEKNMQVKISQLDQLNEKLKKRNQSLMEEIEELRKLLESRNKEDEKEENNMEIKVENNNYKSSVFKKYAARSSSQGVTRVIRRSNEPVNVVVSTTKISYRRRNETNS